MDLPGDSTAGVTDDVQRLESILDALGNGELARRIAEAARLAVAEHLDQMARDIQSAIEAEDSKC